MSNEHLIEKGVDYMPPELEENKQIKIYDDYIMQDLRQRKGLDKNNSSHDESIMEMSRYEALNEVCDWNGLIGYGSTIKDWIESIYGINLDSWE
jgi:hypothetical protein